MAAIPTLCEVNFKYNDITNADFDELPIKFRNSSILSSVVNNSRVTPSNAGHVCEFADSESPYAVLHGAPESYLVGYRTPPNPIVRSHTSFSTYNKNAIASTSFGGPHRSTSHYYQDHLASPDLLHSSTPHDLLLIEAPCPHRLCLQQANAASHARHQSTNHGQRQRRSRLLRAKTAPPVPSSSAQEQRLRPAPRSSYHHGDEGEEKLQWIPALNTWVSNKQNHNRVPYVNFVNSVNLVQRSDGDEQTDGRIEDLPILPCSRFLSHMNANGMSRGALLAASKEAESRKSRVRQSPRIVAKSRRSTTNSNINTEVKGHTNTQPIVKDKSELQNGDKNDNEKSSSPESTPASDEVMSTHSDSKDNGVGVSVDLTDASPQVSLNQTPDLTDLSSRGEDLNDHMTALALESTTKSASSPARLPTPSPVPRVPTPAPKPPTPPPPSAPREPTPPPTPPPPTPPPREATPRPSPIPAPDPPLPASKVQALEEIDLRPSINNEKASKEALAPTPVEKRQRWRAQKIQKKIPTKEAPPSPKPAPPQRKTSDWIFDAEDFSEPLPEPEPEVKVEVPGLPKPPSPVAIPTVTEEAPKVRIKTPEPLPKAKAKKKRGKPKKDASYLEEMRRQELAEQRLKALAMFNKMKKKVVTTGHQDNMDAPCFDDYGWLAKYCIFNSGHLDMYRRAFDTVDEGGKGHLTYMETFMGLRGINRGLTDAEEEYMFRILEIAGYKVTDGADFKLFAVMAALSQRINSVDQWLRNLIGRIDMQMLTMKMFMCKTLWDYNVDEETRKISLDQLCIELRAGGVSYEHECEVKEKLRHLVSLDLLDFLTYMPLFIMIHQSVVQNPLDDSRVK